MQRVEGSTRTSIASFASTLAIDSVMSHVYDELSQLLLQKIERPVSKGACSAIDVTPYLQACLLFIEKHLLRMVDQHHSHKWLWFLRRLPREVFEGSISTTIGYDWMLAETLSARGGQRESRHIPQVNGRIIYNVDTQIVQEVLCFCAGVIFLSHIQVLLRYAGKGCLFQFNPRNAIPKPSYSFQEGRAIRLYDQRIANSGQPFSRSGTSISSPISDVSGLVGDPSENGSVVCV